jgi:hypothetical protein
MGGKDYRLVLEPMSEVQDERHYGVCGNIQDSSIFY